MELFRQIADDGKTVVCITHNLANVEATCHLVAILTEGAGSRSMVHQMAKSYFGVARLGEVYRMLSKRPGEQWEMQFRRVPTTASTLPIECRAGEANKVGAGAASRNRRSRPSESHPAIASVDARYVSVWRGDSMALAAMLGQNFARRHPARHRVRKLACRGDRRRAGARRRICFSCSMCRASGWAATTRRRNWSASAFSTARASICEPTATTHPSFSCCALAAINSCSYLESFVSLARPEGSIAIRAG